MPVAICDWVCARPSANKIGSPVDQVLLFCFHYDPTVGKYGVAVINFVRLGGVLTLLAWSLHLSGCVDASSAGARSAVAGYGQTEIFAIGSCPRYPERRTWTAIDGGSP